MEIDKSWLEEKIALAEEDFEKFLHLVNKLPGYQEVQTFIDQLSDERFLEWIAFLQGVWYWSQMINQLKDGDNPPFDAVILFDRYMTHVFN